MRKIEFGITDNNVNLLTEDTKLSEITHISILLFRIIKEYSETNPEAVDYEAIKSAILASVENDSEKE